MYVEFISESSACEESISSIFQFSYFLSSEGNLRDIITRNRLHRSTVSRVFNFTRKFRCQFNELSSGENRVLRLSLIFPPPRANNELPSLQTHQTFTAIFSPSASKNPVGPQNLRDLHVQ